MKTEGFTKVPDELIACGLPLRLAMLYGRLVFHAKNGKCYAKHDTLAEEIGLKSENRRRQVIKLLSRLERLKLIEWERGRYGNTYRVLHPDVNSDSHLKPNPDVNQSSRQMGTGVHISDVNRSSHRKESYRKKQEYRKEEEPPPECPVRVNGQPERNPAAAAAPQPKKWEAFAALYPPQKLNHAKAKIEWGGLTASQQAAAVAWLERNRNCPQWLADNGQYIPLASNFLKRLEFESPPPPVIQRKGPKSFAEKELEKHQLGVARMEYLEKLKRGG